MTRIGIRDIIRHFIILLPILFRLSYILNLPFFFYAWFLIPCCSQGINLPESPFASPIVSGISTVIQGFKQTVNYREVEHRIPRVRLIHGFDTTGQPSSYSYIFIYFYLNFIGLSAKQREKEFIPTEEERKKQQTFGSSPCYTRWRRLQRRKT